MYLIKPKLSNRIKTISIENCIVKINDNNEIEKKISVEQIQKIYAHSTQASCHRDIACRDRR